MKTLIKKRLLSLLLACAAAASLAVPVFADQITFSDVPPTHWAYRFIMDTTEKGVFTGTTTPVNGVGTFEPEATMTRAEFITVLAAWLFPDELSAMERPAQAPWWYCHYQVALNNGILKSGELDGGAMDRNMTRQEAAVVLARVCQALGLTPDQSVGVSGIADWYNIDGGYWDGVDMTYSLGLIGGVDAAGTFDPMGTLTRAQAATVVSNLLGKAEAKPVTPDQFDSSLIQVECSMLPQPADNGIEGIIHYSQWKPEKTLEFIERMCSGELCPPGLDPELMKYRVEHLSVSGPGWSKGEKVYDISFFNSLEPSPVYSRLRAFPDFAPFILPPYTQLVVCNISYGDPYWDPIHYRLSDLFLQETVSEEIRTIALAMLKDYQERAQAVYATNDPEVIDEYEYWWYSDRPYAEFRVDENYYLSFTDNLTVVEIKPYDVNDPWIPDISAFEWFNEANKPQ